MTAITNEWYIFGPGTIDIVVVAGGGSGGCNYAGGGGGGGVVYKTGHALAAGAQYDVVIGAGGAGQSSLYSSGNTGKPKCFAMEANV